jgi:DNA-binding NarL/FixJ family response regulator
MQVPVQEKRLKFMEKIKVMLASRPKLLSEVIRNMIEHQPDMEMVGEVLDPLQLLSTSMNTSVDAVIITPLRANGEPKICHQLLLEHPRLKVITLSSKGEAAYLYQSGVDKKRIDNPSEQSILDAIRGSLLPIASQ